MARVSYAQISSIGVVVGGTATTTTAIAQAENAGTATRIGVYIANTGGTNALLVRLRSDVSADVTTITATASIAAGGIQYFPVGSAVGIDVEAAASTTTYTITEVIG